MISEIVGMKSLLGSVDRWRYLLGLALGPSAIQLIALIFAPESPRWLYMKNHDEAAAAGACVRECVYV